MKDCSTSHQYDEGTCRCECINHDDRLKCEHDNQTRYWDNGRCQCRLAYSITYSFNFRISFAGLLSINYFRYNYVTFLLYECTGRSTIDPFWIQFVQQVQTDGSLLDRFPLRRRYLPVSASLYLLDNHIILKTARLYNINKTLKPLLENDSDVSSQSPDAATPALQPFWVKAVVIKPITDRGTTSSKRKKKAAISLQGPSSTFISPSWRNLSAKRLQHQMPMKCPSNPHWHWNMYTILIAVFVDLDGCCILLSPLLAKFTQKSLLSNGRMIQPVSSWKLQ